MRECEIKSTGFLVDELITTDLKVAAGIEVDQERRHCLGNTIIERTAHLVLNDMEKYREFQRVTAALSLVLKDCWNAQEVFKHLPSAHECSLDQIYEMACAGERAQEENAARNRLVRRLDELVGETHRTQLSKTYDKGND